MIKKRKKRKNDQGKQKRQKLDIEQKLPPDIALKIAAEYSPAPYVDRDCIFFNISINQQVDGRFNIRMCTYVDMNGRVDVVSRRRTPRELEFAFANIARSLHTTVNTSNIEFLPSIHDREIDTAGLIGPLTRIQSTMNSCRGRRLEAWSTTSKRRVYLLERRNNQRNIDYIQDLIQDAFKKVKTKNQIFIHSVHDRKWNENKLKWERTSYSRSGLCKRIMWIDFCKPRLPISKILSKSYNCKK